MPMKIWAIGDTSMTKLISKFYSCSMSSSKDNSLEPSYKFQYSNDDFSEHEDENTSQNS